MIFVLIQHLPPPITRLVNGDGCNLRHSNHATMVQQWYIDISASSSTVCQSCELILE